MTFASGAMKQAKTLKTDELKLVLAYIAVRRHASRNRTIMLASFLSGMRAHELASLKIGDVVDEEGRIRNEIVLTAAQTKGSRSRRVFVNAKLKRELVAYVKTDCVNKPLKIIGALNKKINAVLADPLTKQRFGILGGTILGGTRAEFGKFLGQETEKWGRVIRAANRATSPVLYF